MGHWKQNTLRHPEPSQEEADRLRTLMPMDVFFYEYAKQIHKVYLSVMLVCLAKVTDLHKNLDRNFFNFMGSIHYREGGAKALTFGLTRVSPPHDKLLFSWGKAVPGLSN